MVKYLLATRTPPCMRAHLPKCCWEFFPVITLTPTEHKQLDFTNDFKILNPSYTLANTDGNSSLRNFAKPIKFNDAQWKKIK
uniref:Uncharacterized protein n=1 Tax=Anguilla anguilla TaxID=7936 RepID=A0A0E9PGU1_ANGAN